MNNPREWECDSGMLAVSVGPDDDSVVIDFAPSEYGGRVSVYVFIAEPNVVTAARSVIDSGDADTLRRNLVDFADLLADWYAAYVPRNMMRTLRETPR